MDIKHEIDQIHTEEAWIQHTLSKVEQMGQMEKQQGNRPQDRTKAIAGGKMLSYCYRIATAALVLIILSTGSVFAYNYVKRSKNNNYEAINSASGLDHLSDSSQYGLTLDQIDETVSNKDLKLECTSYNTEDHTVYIGLNISTTDGSALFDEDDDKVAILSRSGFQNIAVAVNDGAYTTYRSDGNYVQSKELQSSCSIMMTGDGSDASSMQYEIVYSNSEITLPGQKLSFQVSGYGTDFDLFIGDGLTTDHLQDLLEDGIEADADDFTPIKISGYGDPLFELLPGENRIQFSDQYPDCYIDNYGFYDRTGYMSQKAFYMTIVCDSDESREALKALRFQSVLSGLNVTAIYDLPDGRIQMIYDINSDSVFSKTNEGIEQDTTMEDLANLVLKLKDTDTDQYISTNNEDLSFDVMLADSELQKIETTPEVVVTSETSQANLLIEELTMDSMSLKVNGTIQNMSEVQSDAFKMFGTIYEYAPVITLKNGVETTPSNKVGGGGNSNTGSVELEWMLSSVMNVNDVEKITWHGTVIYQAQ